MQTLDGKRVSGTLMRVDSSELLVKRTLAIPEPAIGRLRSIVIANIERDKDGGIQRRQSDRASDSASGAGAMLTLILFAMQLD